MKQTAETDYVFQALNHNPIQAEIHAAKLVPVFAHLTSNLNVPIKCIYFWCLLKSMVSFLKKKKKKSSSI